MFKVLTILSLLIMSFCGCSNTLEGKQNISERLEQSESTEQLIECNLYIPDEEWMNYNNKTILVREDNAVKDILHSLKDEHVIRVVSDVNSFEIKENCIKIDLDETFVENFRNQGTTGEMYAIGCFVNTLIDFYDVEGVEISVEREWIETGHNIFDEVLRKFE